MVGSGYENELVVGEEFPEDAWEGERVTALHRQSDFIADRFERIEVDELDVRRVRAEPPLLRSNQNDLAVATNVWHVRTKELERIRPAQMLDDVCHQQRVEGLVR